MGKKNKIMLSVFLLVLVANVLLSAAWVFWPSEGKAIFYLQETGVTVENPLTYMEAVQVKQILYGKIRWPEWIYGYPACGYGKIFAINLDGTYYMPAWDSCGMVAVWDSDRDVYRYINVTQRQIAILEQMIVAQETMK